MASTNPVFIPPTVDGVREVSRRRWRQNRQPVAVPTECTYEVGVPVSADGCNGAIISKVGPTADHADDDQPFVYVHSGFADLFEQVANGSIQGSSSSSLSPMSGGKGPAAPAPPSAKQEGEGTSALHGLLRAHLRPRRYALKREGKVAALCALSESVHVVQRLAAKVWPGPVTLHVACSGSGAGNGSVASCSQQGASYLALRCPCHPLAVKLYKEFYGEGGQDGNGPEGQVLVGSALRLSDDLRCSGKNGSSSIRRYATAASQVAGSVSGAVPVLDGERQLETFAVPTCEYGVRPAQIWIDEGSRRITVRGMVGGGGSSSSADGRAGNGRNLDALLAPESLVQALRSPVQREKATKPTEKDRLVQSVLSKWIVVREESGPVP